MGIPFYPPTSCKVGSFKLGVSLSEFMKLVDKGDIEISDRGGKYPLVNNDTLNTYIDKNGGRLARYNEYIVTETELLQENEILKYYNLILSSAPRGKGRDNLKNAIWSSSTISEIHVNYYTGNEILELAKLIKHRKENRVILHKLYSVGITDTILDKYFKNADFDLEKYKTQAVVFKERLGNVTYDIKILTDFFNSYKVIEKRYNEIDFLTKAQKQSIIEKTHKKFAL